MRPRGERAAASEFRKNPIDIRLLRLHPEPFAERDGCENSVSRVGGLAGCASLA